MTNYFRTPQMQSGKGFRCFNCGKLLAVKLRGEYEVSFRCPRCKAYLFVKMGEKIPWAETKQEVKDEPEVPKMESNS
jgi:phage FluMu protein Com